MRILLSHWTALTLYRRGWVLEGSPPAEPIDPCDAWKGAPGGKASNRALTQVLASCGCCPPIHTLVPASGHRSGAHGFASHCLPRGVVDARATRVRLPASEQLKDAETYVVSPELLFLELARLLGEVGAALLGMELCGRYLRADPQDPREQVARAGFASRREPLMARGEAGGFLGKQPRYVEGARHAIDGLAHVGAGARSPMESAVFLGMTLPARLGGFAIEKPQINVKMELEHREGRVLADDLLEWDYGWSEPPLMDIEYQSRLFHGTAPRARDDRRRNELASDGVVSLAWGPADVMDPVAFETNCLNVARLRGRPFRTELRDFEQRYRRLHSLLFGSGADVG